MTTRDEMDALAASMTAQSKQLRPTEEPTMSERIEIKATDGTVVYSGDVEDMPQYDYFVDAYEEVVNQHKSAGTLGNGWTYTVRRS
jgi:hypothetical protein